MYGLDLPVPAFITRYSDLWTIRHNVCHCNEVRSQDLMHIGLTVFPDMGVITSQAGSALEQVPCVPPRNHRMELCGS